MPSPLRFAGFAVCLVGPAAGCVKTKPFTHAGNAPKPLVGTAAPVDRGRVMYVVADSAAVGTSRTLSVVPTEPAKPSAAPVLKLTPTSPGTPVVTVPTVIVDAPPVVAPPVPPPPVAAESPSPPPGPSPDAARLAECEAKLQAILAERQTAAAEAEKLAREKQALAAQVQQLRQALTAQQAAPPADVPAAPPALLTHLLLAEKDLRLKDIQLESARQQAMAAYQVLAARGHAVPGPVIADFGKTPAAGPITNLFQDPSAPGCRTCNPHNPHAAPGTPGRNAPADGADPNAGVVKLY